MASIFTYEPDPPRVASPWLQSIETEQSSHSVDVCIEDNADQSANLARSPSIESPNLQTKVTKLQAEPQDGPVEYKLHLLLRPRRKFRSTSTGLHISGSRHSKLYSSSPARVASETSLVDSAATTPAPSPGSSVVQQTRQHRLEQLTTQLLWRLQQSSPHHASSATNIILPSLPEALPELQAPQQPAKLLHGLEESQGALYEIGVSDDGTLVGLAEDELQESLNNLRAMAACLGCTVTVLRKEIVGECEWIEDAVIGRKERWGRKIGKLWVAEALIKPSLRAKSPPVSREPVQGDRNGLAASDLGTTPFQAVTEQLRITLTGPTMSGKSTLLGTLTTSTFDNGRGKSRLSMLKHRHEITSGITSSVTQELLGYRDNEGEIDVVNYASANIASWIDVHVASSSGRLVFISDSAGHPRYRRSTVRGLVGWAPHWTLLCVPADDTEDTLGTTRPVSPMQHNTTASVSELDLSGAQMELCLRLKLPLVIVITKLDLASRTGLKVTLSKVLDKLKAAGRKPAILANPPGAVDVNDLQHVHAPILQAAQKLTLPLTLDLTCLVPIVLTSAVQGTGVTNLHALLHELPIPKAINVDSDETSSRFVFHVEDVYSKPAERSGVIASGRLRSGQIVVGSSGLIGPFSTHEHLDDSEDSDERSSRRDERQPLASRSFPGALPHLAPMFSHMPQQEWKRAKVTSIRNLRLPVHSLGPDQVGTLAIQPDELLAPVSRAGGLSRQADSALGRLRKGMVFVATQPIASRSFVARFKREDLESLAVGNHVVAYTASVRVSVSIVSARVPDSPVSTPTGNDDASFMCQRDSRSAAGPPDPFEFDSAYDMLNDSPNEEVAGSITAPDLLVTFRLDATKEFLVAGDHVLVMPGGGPGFYGGQERGEKGIAGLEGFVGQITEVIA